jgi:hypothetical protein
MHALPTRGSGNEEKQAKHRVLGGAKYRVVEQVNNVTTIAELTGSISRNRIRCILAILAAI